MATPVWQPSTFYATGSLVQPATSQPAVPTPIPNPSFESGNVEWTLDAGLSIVNGIEHFGPGTWALQANTGFAGDRFAEMQDFIDCTPGENITAKCQIQQGASSFGNTGGAVGLRFYDSLNGLIQDFRGNEVIDGSGGAWHQSTVTASAPANTAFVRIYIYMKRVNQNLPFWADAVEWNKISQAQSGLIFKAVQPTVGLSGSVEPVWPLVNGAQVVDNEVIWEAILATRITWEAHAILVSGATEPTFPPQEGGTVGDNTIAWRAVSRRVTDPNCPNSKIVIIGASKIFAADDDIVAYSATVNPLDWSSADDAGYIPSNLQQYGANPVAGLGLYRSNLVVMNTQGSQLWQIDEDPSQMALLDAFPVGTAHHDAISPAFNDLFFLSTLGVRTIGIAGGSTNLQSGDAGMPIDTLVQEATRIAVANNDLPFAFYYPAAGQYWLTYKNNPPNDLELTGGIEGGFVGDTPTGGYVATGGIQPYTFSVSSGALPTGITINAATGLPQGVFTAAGSFSWQIKVVDSTLDEAFVNDSANIVDYWNSLDRTIDANGQMVLSSFSRNAQPVSVNPASTYFGVRGTLSRNAGRRYVEFEVVSDNAAFNGFSGLSQAGVDLTLLNGGFQSALTLGRRWTDQWAIASATSVDTGVNVVTGDRIGILMDFGIRRCWMTRNGVFTNGQSPATNPTGLLNLQTPLGPLFPMFSGQDSTASAGSICRLHLKQSEMLFFPVGAWAPFTAWGD